MKTRLKQTELPPEAKFQQFANFLVTGIAKVWTNSTGYIRAQPPLWRRRTKRHARSRDRYLIFVLAMQAVAHFFSLFSTYSSNLLWNFRTAILLRRKFNRYERKIRSLLSRNSFFLLVRDRVADARKRSRLYAARKSLLRARERERSSRLFLSVEKRRRDFFLGMESKPRRLFLFVVRARITLDFPFLSLLFLPSLLPSLLARHSLHGFSLPLLPRLLHLISTEMHFSVALFTCFRPGTSVLESSREHSPAYLSSSEALVKKALVENHCASRWFDGCVQRNVESNGITSDFLFSVAGMRNDVDAFRGDTFAERLRGWQWNLVLLWKINR